MKLKLARDYPTHHTLDLEEVTLRPMERGDEEAVLSFAAALPAHDLLFLRRDITRPATVEEWLAEIERGEVCTLLALRGGEIVGYGTLHRASLAWSSHVAELRIVVAEAERGKGLGGLLTREVFANALANGIEKMVARMTPDQKGAISTFEGLGFRPEALLRDHVKDLEGNRHDLLMMSHDVATFQQTLDSYGVSDALS